MKGSLLWTLLLSLLLAAEDNDVGALPQPEAETEPDYHMVRLRMFHLEVLAIMKAFDEHWEGFLASGKQECEAWHGANEMSRIFRLRISAFMSQLTWISDWLRM